jgi:hypothetical protein
VCVSSMYLTEHPPSDPASPVVETCPRCLSPAVIVTLVTTWYRYCRCQACGMLWVVARSDAPPPAGV